MTSPSLVFVERLDALTEWTNNIGGIHDTKHIGGAGVALGRQVKVVANRILGFHGGSQWNINTGIDLYEIALRVVS